MAQKSVLQQARAGEEALLVVRFLAEICLEKRWGNVLNWLSLVVQLSWKPGDKDYQQLVKNSTTVTQNWERKSWKPENDGGSIIELYTDILEALLGIFFGDYYKEVCYSCDRKTFYRVIIYGVQWKRATGELVIGP